MYITSVFQYFYIMKLSSFFKNKSSCNLSQIGQPLLLTFSFGFTHKIPVYKNQKICNYNFAQLYKMQFYAHRQNYSKFYYWKFNNKHQ